MNAALLMCPRINLLLIIGQWFAQKFCQAIREGREAALPRHSPRPASGTTKLTDGLPMRCQQRNNPRHR
jgi:hypothetical protein